MLPLPFVIEAIADRLIPTLHPVSKCKHTMFHKILQPIILLIFPCLLVAQTEPFQLIYGSEQGFEVGIGSLQVPDGSIYMLANVQSDTTTGEDVLLVKVGIDGEVIWSKSYDGGESEFAQDFILKNDRLIIAGESNEIGGLNKDGFILQVDLDGNQLSFSTYGTGSLNEQFQSIAATEDGYIACGFASSTIGVGNDIFIKKFGATPLESWSKTLGEPVNDISMSIAQLPDGHYAVCGDRLVAPMAYNPIVLILDSKGNLLHTVVIDSPYNGGSKNLTVTASGDILVVGEVATPTSSNFDVYVAKVSAEGELLWGKYVPSTDASDAGFGICEVNPGSILVTGYSYNEAAGNTDIVAISLDSLGNEVDRKYFGGPGLDIAYDIQPSATGGILVTGKTSLPTHVDAILIHDFLTLATNAVEPQNPVEQFTISPNPASAGAQLQLPEKWLNAAWTLTDEMGRDIAQGIVNQSIGTSYFPAGTYFLSVKKAGRTGVAKLVLQGK